MTPDLTKTAADQRVSRKRQVRLGVGCKTTGTFVMPPRCRGTVRVFARIGGKQLRIASKRFDFASSQTKMLMVTLRKEAYQQLKTRSLKTTVTATVASGRASKKMTIRKRR